jgi:hypothetical protein
VLGRIWPEATAHGTRWPATRGQPTSWLGLGLAARDVGTGRTRRVRSRRGDHAQFTRASARWRGGGWPVARCYQKAPVGSRGGAGLVKEGWDPPARRGDGEVERWLGAVTRGCVLTGEGVGGTSTSFGSCRKGRER